MGSTHPADSAVGKIRLVIHLALALAVALLSVPLLGWSPASADGEAEVGAAVEDASAVEPPGEDPPAEEPAEPATDEPAADEPADEPVAEAPLAEDATEPEPAPEQPETGARTLGDVASAALEALATSSCDQSLPSVDLYEQYTSFDLADPGGEWINGNVNHVKGNLREGDFVWQRLTLGDVPEGPNEATFSYQYMEGAIFAYDFLDHWTVDGSAPDSVTAPVVGSDAQKREVTVSWTQTGDDTAVILFGAHIASELDHGPGTGAGSISGSPYHVSLVGANCDGLGSRDNQIMVSAIPAGFITITKDAQPNSPQDFDFNIARSDNDFDFQLDDDGDGTLPSSEKFFLSADTYTISEEDIPEPWALTDLVCVNTGTRDATFAYDVAAGVATVHLVDDSTVNCTFTNKQTAELEVDKYWVINGGQPVQEGSEPAHLGLGAQLLVNGASKPWNTGLDGFLQGANVSLDESVAFGNDLCDWATGAPHGKVTEANGTPVNGALPYAATLSGGDNHVTITNAVTCRSSLTVQKVVDNGPAAATQWTVSATPVDITDLAGPSAPGTATGTVTADASYVLAESGGDSRYVQNGPWTCTTYGDVATVDGSQRVSVEPGRSATCTVHNATSKLILRKVVENSNGGLLTPSAFVLHADPGTPDNAADDLEATGEGSFWVNPGTTFRLHESGLDGGPIPTGYSQVSIVCDDGDQASAVKVSAGTATTCVFTNADSPGSLVLGKVVDDNDTGDTTPHTAWTLSAVDSPAVDGQATISGAGGASGSAKAGRYVLSETGPTTHMAGAWDCSVSGTMLDVPVSMVDVDEDGEAESTVMVGLGQGVTCTITNVAIPPRLTLEKSVTDPAQTGAELADDTEWTLVADGPGAADLEGSEGDAEVTGVTVPVGTFELSEGNGPAGYDQVGWVCTAAGDETDRAIGSKVEIALAQHVTCVVENAAVPSTFDVAKSADPADGSTVEEGDVIEYTVSATSNGEGVAVPGVVVHDDLSGVLGSPVVVSADSVAGPLGSLDLDSLDAGVTYDEAHNRLVWEVGTLTDSAEMTYEVEVGGADGATLRNHVTSPGSQNCPPGSDDPDCTTVHHTPEWTLDKSSAFDDTDADGFVDPGQEITYTLTATNTSADADAEILVADNLADVLTWGSIDEDALDPTLSLTGDVLTWTPGTLAAGIGNSFTVSYVVTVDVAEANPDIWGQVLHNVATPESPGGACIPSEGEDSECETTTKTPPVTTIIAEKRALEGDQLLDGAVIQVWDDVDNPGDNATGECVVPEDPAVGPGDVLLGTITTGADDRAGQAWFEDLQRGCYLVVEFQAPPGYDLPEQTTQFVAINDAALAGPVTVLFQDLAQGQLSVVAKRQLELVDGAWVPSDGIIDFGGQVKYVVQVRATGLKTFHDVTLTDYVPGFSPEDTTSTVEAALVPGSAICTGDIACEVTVGPDNLVTWSATGTSPEEIADNVIRNLEVDGVTEGSVEMIVEVPEAPDTLPVGPGETYTATLWNVAFLDYDEVVGEIPDVAELESLPRGMARAAAAFELLHHRLMSNEVVIRASISVPPGGIQPPPDSPPQGGEVTTDGVLPATGADGYLTQLVLLGGLAVAIGVAMAMRGRRKDENTA